MKRKSIMVALLLAITTIYTNHAKAIALGVTFHFFLGPTGGPTDADLQKLICGVNKLYKDQPSSTNMGFVFYIEEIKRNAPGLNSTLPLAILNSARGTELNIYNFGTTDMYNSAEDVVSLTSFSDPVMVAHEIGHFLQLKHPAGGVGTFTCPCTPPAPGDPDCVSDTPPTPSNNIMDQGSTSTGIFTVGQRTRAHGCFGGKGITPKQTQAALHEVGFYNIIPVEHISYDPTIFEMTIDWVYSSDPCPGRSVPSMIEVYTDGCYAPTKFTITDVYNPAVLTLWWGTNKVRIVYYYWNTMQVNQIERTGLHFRANPLALCSNTPSSKGATDVNEITYSSNSFKILNNVSSAKIIVENTGYTSGIIYDLAGKKVKALQFKNGTDNIDVSQIPAGMYIIHATDGTITTREKFIKQ